MAAGRVGGTVIVISTKLFKMRSFILNSWSMSGLIDMENPMTDNMAKITMYRRESL
jgi:hypothetical protein